MTFLGIGKYFKPKWRLSPLTAFWSRLNGSASKSFLTVHTMEINPHLSESGSETVQILRCGHGLRKACLCKSFSFASWRVSHWIGFTNMSGYLHLTW